MIVCILGLQDKHGRRSLSARSAMQMPEWIPWVSVSHRLSEM